jgi:hypothetical protein
VREVKDCLFKTENWDQEQDEEYGRTEWRRDSRVGNKSRTEEQEQEWLKAESWLQEQNKGKNKIKEDTVEGQGQE